MIKYKGRKLCAGKGCEKTIKRGRDKYDNVRDYCYDCYQKVRAIDLATYYTAEDGTKIPMTKVRSYYDRLGFRDYKKNDTIYRYCKECMKWKILSEYADYGSGKRKICKNCK